jgi:hypothetical protein
MLDADARVNLISERLKKRFQRTPIGVLLSFLNDGRLLKRLQIFFEETLHARFLRGRILSRRASIGNLKMWGLLESMPLQCANSLTVARRSVLLRARYFTFRVSCGWHHVTSFIREFLNAPKTWLDASPRRKTRYGHHRQAP